MQLSITRLFYYYCVALLMPLHFFYHSPIPSPLQRSFKHQVTALRSFNPRASSLPHTSSFHFESYSRLIQSSKNTKHHAAIVICDTAMMLHTKDL